MAKLGFVGIGIMGEAMVRRLLERGHEVTVWNLEPERLQLVTPHGAKPAGSPAEVLDASDIVHLCVLDTAAVRNCVFGRNGIASAGSAAGKILIDHSTIDPEQTREMARDLAVQSRIPWIDAPMSGGPGAAQSGTLAMMCGGDPEDFARVRPVLDDLAASCMLMGPVGAGQTTKLINQAIVCTNYVVMAEALALAEAAQLDTTRIPECLGAGFAESRLLRQLYPQMQERRFDPPLGYARQIYKDLKAVRSFSEKCGLRLPVVAAAADQYGEYVGAGHGMTDGASIIRLYRELAEDPEADAEGHAAPAHA